MYKVNFYTPIIIDNMSHPEVPFFQLVTGPGQSKE